MRSISDNPRGASQIIREQHLRESERSISENPRGASQRIQEEHLRESESSISENPSGYRPHREITQETESADNDQNYILLKEYLLNICETALNQKLCPRLRFFLNLDLTHGPVCAARGAGRLQPAESRGLFLLPSGPPSLPVRTQRGASEARELQPSFLNGVIGALPCGPADLRYDFRHPHGSHYQHLKENI